MIALLLVVGLFALSLIVMFVILKVSYPKQHLTTLTPKPLYALVILVLLIPSGVIYYQYWLRAICFLRINSFINNISPILDKKNSKLYCQ